MYTTLGSTPADFSISSPVSVVIRHGTMPPLQPGLSPPSLYRQFVARKVSYRGCSFRISKFVSTCWLRFFPMPTSVWALLV